MAAASIDVDFMETLIEIENILEPIPSNNAMNVIEKTNPSTPPPTISMVNNSLNHSPRCNSIGSLSKIKHINKKTTSSTAILKQQPLRNQQIQKKQDELMLQHKKLKRRAQVAKAARTHRNRKLEMLEKLRQRVEELENELQNLRISRGIAGKVLTGSNWEREAVSQRLKVQKAQQENYDLRHAIHEQMKFNEILRNSLQKIPYSNILQKCLTEEWKNCRLSKDLKRRHEEIKLIADMQMDLLSGALLHAELYDVEEICNKDRINFLHGKPVSYEINRNRLHYGVNMQEVGDVLWKLLCGELYLMKDLYMLQCLEIVDENTRYNRYEFEANGKKYCTKHIIKRFYMKNRIVCIFKAVLYDPLCPDEDLESLGDDSGWFVVEPIGHCISRKHAYVMNISTEATTFRQFLLDVGLQTISSVNDINDVLMDYSLNHPNHEGIHVNQLLELAASIHQDALNSI